MLKIISKYYLLLQIVDYREGICAIKCSYIKIHTFFTWASDTN